MISSMLFWGFQDLNLVSEIAKKIRHSLNIKDFYIQINDIEKTILLMDIYPEEIIRTKNDLSNLYQWLNRNNRKNIIILIDLFSLAFHGNNEENYLSLKKILQLKLKFFFVVPKMTCPQNLKFISNMELNSIYQKTMEYTKIIKLFYEIIINTPSDSHLISSPVPESIVLNQSTYFLFKEKNLYNFIFFPQILRQFNTHYITQNTLIIKLVEIISNLINQENNNDLSILNTIEPDSSSQYLDFKKKIINKFTPIFFVSLERFFSIKNFTPELKFILWLMFLSICDYEAKTENNSLVPKLSDIFFSE